MGSSANCFAAVGSCGVVLWRPSVDLGTGPLSTAMPPSLSDHRRCCARAVVSSSLRDRRSACGEPMPNRRALELPPPTPGK